eukprot:scaffold10336_cov100-Isochrysis_galbana.AAC.1
MRGGALAGAARTPRGTETSGRKGAESRCRARAAETRVRGGGAHTARGERGSRRDCLGRIQGGGGLGRTW